jgi:hypothetical protein
VAGLEIGKVLVQRLLDNISGMERRLKTWESLTVQREVCILTCIIGKVKKGSFKDTHTAYEACGKCVGRDGGSGRKSDPRPCAGLMEYEGETTIGFLPLPEQLRQGKHWAEAEFWIQGG